MTAAEHARAEQQRKILVDFPAIGLDPPAGPFTAQPQLIPSPDVVRSAFVLGAEHRFELCHREPPNRIAPVDKDHVSVVEIVDVEAARGDLNTRRRIALCTLECGGGSGIDLLPENGEIARTCEKS